MLTKTTITIVLIATLAVGWKFRDSDFLRGATRAADDTVKSIKFDNDTAVLTSPASRTADASGSSKAVTGPRKCQTRTGTIYTDEACPAGSREGTVSRGVVTVIPAQRPVASPGTDKPLPNVRDVLLPKDDVNLQEKRMDAIIGK